MCIVKLLRTAVRAIPVCLILHTPISIAAETTKKDNELSTELTALDNRFREFSSHFYSTLNRADKPSKIDSMESLTRNIDRYRNQNQSLNATAAILNNLALVEKNIDTTPIINICAVLLETNEWNTASQLYKKLKKQGDKSLVSNVSFSFAKYHFARNQWKETIEIVESIRSDLPPEDFHHALLMHGISLQHFQKHRIALKEYEKIPSSSRYYAAARLNMAVANIRQDWWTDAHIIINELLNEKGRKREHELTDRLYTVLGYSLLQQQYFRNSRDAFRNVSLNGKYTNQALLGLALTAAYQEDYVGALNAVNILRDKKSRDLAVDEANLLLPYFYEKLKQLTTANTGYLEAIKYYEGRTQNIRLALSKDSDTLIKQVAASDSSTISVNDEILELGDKLPRFIFDNIRLLVQFQSHIDRLGDTTLRREYETVNSNYRNVLRKTVQAALDQKISHLTHYMNQSRYGLARMQDHDAIAPQ